MVLHNSIFPFENAVNVVDSLKNSKKFSLWINTVQNILTCAKVARSYDICNSCHSMNINLNIKKFTLLQLSKVFRHCTN